MRQVGKRARGPEEQQNRIMKLHKASRLLSLLLCSTKTPNSQEQFKTVSKYSKSVQNKKTAGFAGQCPFFGFVKRCGM